MRLTAGPTQLAFSTDGPDWCQVELVQQERRTPLGAEKAGTIRDRLLKALRRQTEGAPSGRIAGLDVIWVLSLAERHATIFMAREAPNDLFIQDAEGRLLARIDLSDIERQRWIDTIEA